MSLVRMESCIMHASCVYLHNSNFSYIPVYTCFIACVSIYSASYIYHIRSVRCHGYYLFHHAKFTASIQERLLFQSGIYFKLCGIGKIFVNVRALRKASFIRSTKMQ